MNKTSRFAKLSTMALALVAGLLVSTDASAKERQDKNQSHVVAHIPFTGLSPVNMVIQKQGDDKYYLYVQHAKNEGISIVDVGRPARPKAVGVVAWPDVTLPGTMNLTGNLALIAQSEALPMPHEMPTDDLVLWDISKPATPRVVQKFSGVVKWLEDERNFIYVLNNDGLWVISQPEEESLQPDVMAVPLYQ